jgi:predicted nucleic acid-binding protein
MGQVSAKKEILMVLAYLDTCVWLSALYKRHPKHNIALSIFNEARKGNYTIFVTHHVLSEVFDVLKKKMVTSQKVRSTLSASTLEKLVKAKYAEFGKTILALTSVRFRNPYASTNQVFYPSFVLLNKYFGKIKQENKCPICDNTYKYIECDTIYEGDALHVLLAFSLNCDVFITFDDDFTQLVGESSLAPMAIKVY